MASITGGRAVVEALEAEDVDVVFGIPGEHILMIYDALIEHPRMRHVLSRHEQGAAFMAQGYAMASGKPGVCFATTGPGAFNALTALGEAYGDSTAVLLIAGEIDSPYIGRAKGVTHESKDQLGVLARVTGWSAQANTVKEIPSLIHQAFVRFTSGRPRPVALQIPLDVLEARAEVAVLPKAEAARPPVDAERVRQAARLLAHAERPVLWAGGGVNIAGANDELKALAEALSAPVVTTMQGKGAIPEDHPLALGNWSGQGPVTDLISRADVMVAIGTRFAKRLTKNWTLPIPRRLIRIDIDASEMGKNYPAEIELLGDARAVLGQLVREVSSLGIAARPSVIEDVDRIRQRTTEAIRSRFGPEMAMIDALRATLDRDAIIFTDTAIGTLWMRSLLPVHSPRTFFGAGGFSTLGFAVPAAIGAKVAFPDRKVLAACGDGGFMFTCQELATAVQEGLGITILVFNNRAHQVIKDDQTREFGGRYIAVDLVNPDFVRFAESFGALGLRAETPEQLEAALNEALASGKPALVEVLLPIRPFQPTTLEAVATSTPWPQAPRYAG